MLVQSLVLTSRNPKVMARKGNIPWNKGKKAVQPAWNKGLKLSTFPQYAAMGFQKGNDKWNNENVKATQFVKGRSASPKTQFEKGCVPSPIAVEKARQRKGVLNPLWKHGLSKTPSYLSHKNNTRRLQQIGNGGSHSLQQWEELKQRFGHMCLCCKRVEPEIQLTRDHIVPVSKGGKDYIDNIQPLCRSCNSQKQTKRVNFIEVLQEIELRT